MKITLYAYGRFNQTMGRLLRDFFEVQVYHHNQKGLDRVEADGFATVRTIEEACSADLVFLGVPIQKTRQTLLDLRPHLSNTTTIVEQCSVKELPLQWCQEVL
ncbi:MAG: prephenate dehydrogenase/arogenate dehydrogenase family protein [Patescibacteria group bacterium]|nr:prephenate dehydrogenase/arogenate dehydrogenase family protein [Patescibacteria group bacterium]